MKRLLLFLPFFLFASEVIIPQDATTTRALSIYNDNLATINETRTISQKVEDAIRFEGVAKEIIHDSVLASFDTNVSILSQNYQYDVISLDKIFDKLLGHRVSFWHANAIKEGTLISLHPVMIQTDDQIYYDKNLSQNIILKEIPKNLAIKPSLLWRIQQTHSPKELRISYLTRGLSWRSNYVIDQDEEHLKGYITVTNHSGNSYEQSALSLIAGEINQVKNKKSIVSYRTTRMANIAPKSLSGLYRYEIPFKVNLLDNEVKQILFLDKAGINTNIEKKCETHNASYRFATAKLRFDTYLTFENSKENQLGVPLPAGVIRVYNDGQFVGEDSIAHTPNHQKVRLRLSKDFDLFGERVQEAYEDNDYVTKSTIKTTITNPKPSAEEVIIDEHIDTTRNKIATTCADRCSYRIINANTLRYVIKLKADETIAFSTQYIITK
jgi:hypothetical protein